MSLQREILKASGVRVTLLRVKVLQALQLACEKGVSPSLSALQDRLIATGNPVARGPLRQVLCKLESAGLLVRRGDEGWSLAPLLTRRP